VERSARLAKTGRRVTVVGINPDSIALAREYFSSPVEVSRHVDDGFFLMYHDKPFDAMVIDACTDGWVPHHLCSTEFFQLVGQKHMFGMCLPAMSSCPMAGTSDCGQHGDAGLKVRLLQSPWPAERNTSRILFDDVGAVVQR
jgi:hypothetical protein